MSIEQSASGGQGANEAGASMLHQAKRSNRNHLSFDSRH